MRALLVPNDPTDRDLARKLWARLDVIHGYPRTLSEAEITRTGPASQSAPLPHTETLFSAWRHDLTGAAQLHGVGALVVDDPPDGMLRRNLTYAGVTRTFGQWIVWLETNRGWQRWSGALPGQADAWTLIAVRDGEPGSSTGEPIPEGQE